jgi:hypothetical protein
MHATTPVQHPDQRLLEAVRQLGDWLAAEERVSASERLARMLDAPVRHAILADLSPLERAAA